VISLVFAAGSAYGAYGDTYGAAPINDGAGPAQEVPALPGVTRAFWAGTCDLSAAPAPGPAPIPGGIGSRPDAVLAPTGLPPAQALWTPAPPPGGPFTVEFPPGSGQWWLDFDEDGQPDEGAPRSPAQIEVPAPTVPDHCIDWGAQTLNQVADPSQHNVWQTIPWGAPVGSGGLGQSDPTGSYTPSWRLPAVTQAGSHPDGTTMFAWNRNTEGIGAKVGEVDGGADNIVVDLPPGFVGNPQAVPECAKEEFTVVPLQCPPESQVGVLRLNIEAVGGGGANLGGAYDTTYPVYNLEPRPGRVAELGFAYASGENAAAVRLVGKARTNGDFGVTAFTGQIPSALPPIAQQITLWGVPWAAENDMWRPKQGHFEDESVSPACSVQPETPSGNQYIPPGGLRPECRASYDPSWGISPSRRAIKPFLTSETDCNPAPTVTLRTDAYQRPGAMTAEDDPDPSDPDWKTYTSTSPAVTGCSQLDFAPNIDFSPTTSAADGATGLKVDLSIPQNNDPKDGSGNPLDPPAPGASPAAIEQYVDDATAYWRSPDGWATAHLKDTVVTLPSGVAVNPSGATGLRGCPDSVVGVRQQGDPLLFNNVDPADGEGVECPAGSKIGTVAVETPLLDETLTGDVILGEPETTNPQGENGRKMLRLFLVVRNKERGLIAKIYGSSVADPSTGQLTTTFKNNPELPFEKLTLEFKGGSKGLLAMPPRCGSPGWTSTFTPWSAAHGGGGANVDDTGAFNVASNCAFGFSPSLAAGMDTQRPSGSGTFSLRFSRNDGEQWFKGLSVEMPTGLLASVRGVPLCSNADANRGDCPAGSRIGAVDATAGSGDPFVIEKKGDAYLTEGYKGAPYGLMVKVPVEAGPFRGDKALTPIIVRQALHVDRGDASVTAVSDPLPHIHHGIPLRAREITAIIDRTNFMRNPSNCSRKEIKATLVSLEGVVAAPTSPFQVSGCAALPFKPRLALRLTGRKQVADGKHPGLRAVLTQRPGEAGMARAVTRLPLSLALDPYRAQSDDLCEFEEARKEDPNCPARSIIGRARAFSPLLNRPLEGPVYFAKNVRIHPKTGNPIRTLPTLVTELSGEIDLVVRATTDTHRGKLVTTFPAIPDAPVDRFELNLSGGKDGILAVSGTNLCRRPRGHITEVDTDGHNGKRRDFNVRMKTPCTKKKRSKRQARLRIGKVRRSGINIGVAGRVSKVATRNVKVTVRCGKTRVSKRAYPDRAGSWRTKLAVGRRCANGRARVVVRYPGGPKLEAQTRSRVVAGRSTARSMMGTAQAALASVGELTW
jgi:hypothetical protein